MKVVATTRLRTDGPLVDSRLKPEEQALLQRLIASARQDSPKYSQLCDALTQAIDAGVWKSGAALPSEQELVKATPFSLGTVQRAIRVLVDEGRLRRVKGRGTFVTDGRIGIVEPFLHTRFLDEESGGLMPVYATVASRRRIRIRGPWSEPLQQRGSNIVRIERRLDIAGHFIAFSRFYINADRFPEFSELPLEELSEGNYKLMLARMYKLPTLAIMQHLELGAAPPDVAKMMGVRANATCALLSALARTAHNEAIYFHQIHYPVTRFKLVLPEVILSTGR